jgi:hypothetical protein
LRKLSEHRCPECGRAFDPSDAKSFASLEVPHRLPFKQFVVVGFVSVALALLSAFVLFSLVAPQVEFDGLMLLVIGINVAAWTPINYYALAILYRLYGQHLRRM